MVLNYRRFAEQHSVIFAVSNQTLLVREIQHLLKEIPIVNHAVIHELPDLTVLSSNDHLSCAQEIFLLGVRSTLFFACSVLLVYIHCSIAECLFNALTNNRRLDELNCKITRMTRGTTLGPSSPP